MSQWFIQDERPQSGLMGTVALVNPYQSYHNQDPQGVLQTIRLSVQASTLKVLISFNPEHPAREALYDQLCTVFPIPENETFLKRTVPMVFSRDQRGLREAARLFDYLQETIEAIEPEAVRQAMKRTLGIEQTPSEEEIDSEIRRLVETGAVSEAISFAEQSNGRGYTRAFYHLGIVLHEQGYLLEAFHAFEQVRPSSEEDFLKAKESQANLILGGLWNLDENTRLEEAFKYLCLAGNAPDIQRLRKALVDHCMGGSGFGEIPIDPKPSPETVLFLAKAYGKQSQEAKQAQQAFEQAQASLASLQTQASTPGLGHP